MERAIGFILNRLPFISRRLDVHMLEVINGAAVALVLKMLGAVLAFAFNIAVARLLGAEGAGLYFLALSVTTIGSVIGRVGLDNALLRFVAVNATHGDWDKVNGVYALGMRMAIAAASAITLIVFIAAPWMAETLLNKPDLTWPLRWMSLSILPFSLLNLHAESLKGLKRIPDAMLVRSIGLPLISLLLIYPLSQLSGLIGVILAYSAGTIMSASLGVWAWHRALSGNVTTKAYFPVKELWASCKPLLMVAVMNRAVLHWAPIFLLGIWATNEEVGIFGVASRTAMLVSFMLAASNNILAPKFSELYARGDIEAMGQTARRSALMITMLASPSILVLIFGGHWVMALFGPRFARGGLVLAILTIGQIVNTLAGSVSHFLIATGDEAIVRNTVVMAALAQTAICAALIPWFGSVGAAVAVAIGTSALNLTSAYMVWRRHGVVTIPFLQGAS
jgi:O-antigen/teichoic acid export membrane protein